MQTAGLNELPPEVYWTELPDMSMSCTMRLRTSRSSLDRDLGGALGGADSAEGPRPWSGGEGVVDNADTISKCPAAAGADAAAMPGSAALSAAEVCNCDMIDAMQKSKLFEETRLWR